ncbi:CS1 type fimbrial major subunit [Pseudomonas sp. JR33AA]|uniref:CS1 type fimbrial major subunit n=1 Tax=Pseudomonas sp. JR33AA TaxID=2899113 RepID=UPI001F48242C|nr:CS1 type fimbrial major subunit [Pseudomonas sp. JR33AA]MCE5976069.1 fimbrial protein [Pseudomonas sp. JR33AA]
MKSYVLAVPFIALFAGAAVASAPEPISRNISVTAIIPGNDFSVAPVGDWLDRGVTLEYEPEREDFKAVNEKFSAQSDVGAIQAHLLETAALQDSQTDEKINLAITVGGKQLGLTPAEVMSAEDAKVGNDLPITFNAIKPDAGYVKGEYAGVVRVLFETSSTSL